MHVFGKIQIVAKLVVVAMAFLVIAENVACAGRLAPAAQESTKSNTSVGMRAWRPPPYVKSEFRENSALGWSSNAFATPPALRARVKFWIDIYSKYTSSQGVLHDSDDMSKIYEVVDFTDIDHNKLMTRSQKERAKEHRLAAAKKKISAKLNKDDRESLRFQQGLSDRFEQAIFTSGRYLEDMEKIFKEEGLPIELTRLVFVESSFNIFAQSKVGASGLWQIMRSTGRGYLKINSTMDLRNHPLAATRAAAHLLETNYRLLGSWPLAITGWNHGPAGVRKMTQAYHTQDLGSLIENVTTRRSFGFASRNFFACFLAALEVEKNAPKYFEHVAWAPRLRQEEIKLPTSIHYQRLLGWFDGDAKSAQLLNPHLTAAARKGRITLSRGTPVYVPVHLYDYAVADLGRRRVANSH